MAFSINKLIRPIAKSVIPKSQYAWLRDKLFPLRVGNDTYENVYETYAREIEVDQVIGAGDFELIGRLELALLQMEGLRPDHTLVDLGCGIGRLALHAIPALKSGSYIGIDISQTMLKRARAKVDKAVPNPPCTVKWLHQTTSDFELPRNSTDMICAFSAFTHMEHEDSYRYLKEALRIIKPGGRFIFSCLPLNLAAAKEVFQSSARMDLKTRWKDVRNVTTSVDYMTEIARLAGWEVVRWYAGDQPNIGPVNNGKMYPLGQASCILEAPAL